MMLRTGALCCSFGLWIVLLILVGIAIAQPDPKSEISSFDNLPARIFFFHDTDVRKNWFFSLH